MYHEEVHQLRSFQETLKTGVEITIQKHKMKASLFFHILLMIEIAQVRQVVSFQELFILLDYINN